METKILHESEMNKVVAVYLYGKLLYTRTYIKDTDGYVDRMITVFANGDYDIQ